MLRVTADVFSGLENPSWYIDEAEAAEILRELAQGSAAMSAADAELTGVLGYRGLVLDLESEHLAEEHGLPSHFRINTGQGAAEGRGAELAERLVAGMFGPNAFAAAGLEGQDETLRDFLMEQIGVAASRGPALSSSSLDDLSAEEKNLTPAGTPGGNCIVERTTFNPSFWNGDLAVQRRNNCYNYASNRRTNTFAQPGRAAGRPITQLSCAEATAASLADGATKHGTCRPESDKPRWLMALVVAPGRDYHWYRMSAEGFWGHKPGQTPATNLDNSRQVIRNPERCDRGMYTQFCGYFYSGKTHRVS